MCRSALPPFLHGVGFDSSSSSSAEAPVSAMDVDMQFGEEAVNTPDVMPGQKLGECERFESGSGTYIRNKSIYASLLGVKKVVNGAGKVRKHTQRHGCLSTHSHIRRPMVCVGWSPHVYSSSVLHSTEQESDGIEHGTLARTRIDACLSWLSGVSSSHYTPCLLLPLC